MRQAINPLTDTDQAAAANALRLHDQGWYVNNRQAGSRRQAVTAAMRRGRFRPNRDALLGVAMVLLSAVVSLLVLGGFAWVAARVVVGMVTGR